MIARIWHGRTKVEDYEAYSEFMKIRAIPDYRKTNGFVKLVFLRNIRENAGHFTLVTFWENLEVIKNFTKMILKRLNIILKMKTFYWNLKKK